MLNKTTAIRLLLCVIIIALLQGCTTVFDHSAYVKALLDASYKAEFAEYVILTGSTEDEAREQYNANINTVSDDICLALGSDIPGEKLKSVVEKVFNSVSYEVLSAEKIEAKQYDVEIKIMPVVNFINLEKELTGFTEVFTERIYSKELIDENPEDVYKLYIDGITDIIEKQTENIEYGGETSLKVPVVYDKDKKIWLVTDEWQKKIFDTLISL